MKEVMRHTKVKKQGVRQCERHNNITLEKAMENQKKDIEERGYSNIELDNVKLNTNLIKSSDFMGDIQKKLDSLGIKPRKDAVFLLEGVYTFSPEFCPNLICYLHRKNEKWKEREENREKWEKYVSTPKEKRDKLVSDEYHRCMSYFKECVRHEEKHYGTCINAVIHFHEGCPHLHTDSIPLIIDHEKSQVRLSGKDIIGNKKKMSESQTLFHEEVGKRFGLERGEIKETGSLRKHISKEKKALEDLKKDLQKAQEELEAVKGEKYQLEELNADLRSKLDGLQRQIEIERQIKEDMEKVIIEITPQLETLSPKKRWRCMEKVKKIEEDHQKVKDMIKDGRVDIMFGSFEELGKEIHEDVKDLESDLDSGDYE